LLTRKKGAIMAKAPAASTQVALFEDQLAALAVESLKAEQSSLQTTFLSTKSGTLTYSGDAVAGNKLACVILAAPVERLYYSTRYDPTKIVGPDCFAIASMATGMGPNSASPQPQHSSCEGCPKNEWGSSPTGGKGKACRETRRLLVIPADAITSAESVKAAEVAALRPPVTSLKNYATYVQTVAASLRRPPLAVISEIAVVPDPKTQFKVTFNMLKAIDDPVIISALVARSREEVEKAITSAGVVDDSAPQVEEPATESTRF
jgi:hypothetical protein